MSPAALDHLRTRGVEAVAVPSGQLSALSNAATTSTFTSQFELAVDGGPNLRAVVADDVTAARLTQADDPVLAGHRALAELAYLQYAAGAASHGIAVRVPESTPPAALATFLDGLATTTGTNGIDGVAPGEPMVSPVTLGDLFQVTATATAAGQPHRSPGAHLRGRSPCRPRQLFGKLSRGTGRPRRPPLPGSRRR